MLFFIGYSVRTAQITPRNVIKTHTFAYGILFIGTYALRGPKDTYIPFKFENETNSLYVHKLLFFSGYSVRRAQITPRNVIKTYTFAYGILFISTYALRGPKDTYIPFQFENEKDSLYVHKLLFFIGYSVRTAQITPRNVIKTYEFAYGILFISTYALRGPKVTYIPFQFENEKDSLYVHKLLFFIGYSVRTAQITPRNVIKTYTFAYGILFISTYALRGPKGTYIPFQFENETTRVPTVKLLFFIGYSVRTPKITPRNVIKTYTFAYGVLYISTYALRGPKDTYIPFQFENEKDSLYVHKLLFFIGYSVRTAQITPRNVIKTYTFAYGILFISTYALRGPKGTYIPFQFENETTRVPTVKLLFFIGYSVRTPQITPRNVIKTYTFAYGVLFISTYALRGPKDTYIPFQFEIETTRIPTVKLLFFIGYYVRTAQIIPSNVIKTHTLAYGILFISTYALKGPKGTYIPFQFENETTRVPTVKLLFFIGYSVRTAQITPSNVIKTNTFSYGILFISNYALKGPKGTYIPFQFENETTRVPTVKLLFFIGYSVRTPQISTRNVIKTYTFAYGILFISTYALTGPKDT